MSMNETSKNMPISLFAAAANTQDDATACVEKLQQNPTANGCINRYTTLLHSLPEPTFFFLFKTICS